MRMLLLVVFATLLLAEQGQAAEVKIVAAKARQQVDSWSFSVTLKHDDSGWDHYADAWRVVSAQGKVLGSRILFHPHENEQPFTRSLDGISIPASTAAVFIEAHDKRHGWAAQRFEVKLENR